MHKPTNDERKTFARALATQHNTTARQIRKMRQRGLIKSQPAEMPWERPRFRALVG